MIYRIVKTENLPPEVDAAMSGDGMKVIYIRPSLTPAQQRRAVRKVLRAQKRKLAAVAFPLALASRALVRGAQRVPWQAAMATGGAAAAGTAAVVGLHLGAPPPRAAGALPPPVRAAATAHAGVGPARPHPGTAPGGGRLMTGHRGHSPLHAPVPAASGPGQAHGPARVQEAVPHERATLPGARVSAHATGPSVPPQPRVSVPPLAVPSPSVVPQPTLTVPGTPLPVPTVTLPPVPPVPMPTLPVPHVTPPVPVPTVPPLPVPHIRPTVPVPSPLPHPPHVRLPHPVKHHKRCVVVLGVHACR